jgi:hypothetical protein
MARTGRPASTDLAPNALASYMREYRAWKSGRGSKPAGRAAYVAEYLAAEADILEAAYGRDELELATRSWTELRDAVLAVGGIAPNADYSVDSMPRPVYRLEGKPADLVPMLLEPAGFYFDGDAELISELNQRFDSYRRAA